MSERGEGVWRLRVVTGYRPTGQPIQASRTFRGTKRQAESALAKFVAETEQGNAARSGPLTFGSFLTDRYLPHVKANLGPETYRNHLSKASKRLIPDLGRVRMDKLTAAHLDAAYIKWRQDGLKASTVKAHHLVVSSALSQAVKWQLLPRSVAPLATLPRAEPRQHTTPTIDQIRRLVAASAQRDPVLSVAIMIAALTGARRGELLGLRWSDVDRDGMTLAIGRAVKRSLGGDHLVGPTKTHTTRRLSIDEATLAVLDAHRAQCEEWAATGRVNLLGDSYMVTWDPSGQTPGSPDVLTGKFARLAASAGFPDVRFHDLRHAVATSLLAGGFDPAVVAGRLGHSSPLVTMRVYAHALESRDRQAAGVMGSLLASTNAP